MSDVEIEIVVVEGGHFPEQGSKDAIGYDIRARTDGLLGAGGTAVVPAGFRMAIPRGWEAQIRPRSGWATQGVTVLNSPGTIDPDFRGEVGVILHNAGPDTARWSAGDRIAQMVIKRQPLAKLVPVGELGDTERGEGGFGSTGVA